MNAERARVLNAASVGTGPVVYWMQRDQRVQDNWALLYAAAAAKERQVPLMVLFNLVPVFGKTTLRHYQFMFGGLAEVEAALRACGIGLHLLEGEPTTTIPEFVVTHGVGEVVTDFNPLRFTRAWREAVGKSLTVRLTEVDAHNVIPTWIASDKAEFAAYTFRPKVKRALSTWLTEIPRFTYTAPAGTAVPPAIDWERLLASRETDRTVEPVTWCTPGTSAAEAVLDHFLAHTLDHYDADRNDPTKDGQSNLSPYLHFGQISAQRVALQVEQCEDISPEAKAAYLEELIVRRELTDNYCYYTPQYDSVAGAHAWAQKTIREHAADTREYIYTQAKFDAGETHDELWNAMQQQLRREGKLHGWCRMYWAKKILEWTPDAQTAIDIALYLNDRYELDGTDPNGIVGVMWSICGVHDRAWNERPIFGKIRYMNFAGAKRKFDVAAYIARYQSSAESTLFHD